MRAFDWSIACVNWKFPQLVGAFQKFSLKIIGSPVRTSMYPVVYPVRVQNEGQILRSGKREPADGQVALA